MRRVCVRAVFVCVSVCDCVCASSPHSLRYFTRLDAFARAIDANDITSEQTRPFTAFHQRASGSFSSRASVRCFWPYTRNSVITRHARRIVSFRSARVRLLCNFAILCREWRDARASVGSHGDKRAEVSWFLYVFHANASIDWMMFVLHCFSHEDSLCLMRNNMSVNTVNEYISVYSGAMTIHLKLITIFNQLLAVPIIISD